MSRLCQLAGITVSTGWMAGTRASAIHADETPARAAGGTRYVHLACTAYLTCMQTGDRSAEAIDAG